MIIGNEIHISSILYVRKSVLRWLSREEYSQYMRALTNNHVEHVFETDILFKYGISIFDSLYDPHPFLSSIA